MNLDPNQARLDLINVIVSRSDGDIAKLASVILSGDTVTVGNSNAYRQGQRVRRADVAILPQLQQAMDGSGHPAAKAILKGIQGAGATNPAFIRSVLVRAITSIDDYAESESKLLSNL